MSINIPDNIEGVQRDAFIEVADTLIKNPEIDTLFFSGSFYHGDSGPNSDLDFIAITKPEFDYSQRIQDVSHGIFYELFLYSEDQLKSSFERIDYQDMHMVGYGFLVFSKSQNFETVRNLARTLFDKGPAKISDKQLEYEKYILWDKYNDVLDVMEIESNPVKLLMNVLLWDTLVVLYKNKCVWFPKRKRLLKSLDTVDASVSELVNEFLHSSSDKGLQLKILGNIVEKVIYPSKLKDQFTWQSERSRL